MSEKSCRSLVSYSQGNASQPRVYLEEFLLNLCRQAGCPESHEVLDVGDVFPRDFFTNTSEKCPFKERKSRTVFSLSLSLSLRQLRRGHSSRNNMPGVQTEGLQFRRIPLDCCLNGSTLSEFFTSEEDSPSLREKRHRVSLDSIVLFTPRISFSSQLSFFSPSSFIECCFSFILQFKMRTRISPKVTENGERRRGFNLLSFKEKSQSMRFEEQVQKRQSSITKKGKRRKRDGPSFPYLLW
jgi:hypothetical protein